MAVLSIIRGWLARRRQAARQEQIRLHLAAARDALAEAVPARADTGRSQVG